MKVIIKAMLVIYFLLLTVYSCNNEEVFEEQALISEDETDSPEDTGENVLLADDTYVTYQNSSLIIDAYVNDKNIPSNFTITFTNPLNGTLAIDDKGTTDNINDDSVTYTPNADFFGTDSFEYTICDASNTENCDTAIVSITINSIDAPDVSGELKAFPSAYGAGSNASGGRGGNVYYVTTTEDTGAEGSLRWALTRQTTRTVVFKVGGEFELTKGRLRLNGGFHDNLTIAGQTAPGDGVTITGDYLSMSKLDNIIIRYVRFRGLQNSSLVNSDMITATDCTNIIMDHCSGSWGTDEIWSFTASNNSNIFTGNITIQRSLLAEADPSHNTGTLFGVINPDDSMNDTGDFSWNNNYVYNISHRFPNVLGDGRFEIKNNVIYNWKYRLTSAYYGAEVNQQNNFYKAGPVTIAQGRSEGGGLVETLNRVGNNGTPPDIFAKGNLVYPDFITDPNADNLVMWRWFLNSGGKSREDTVPRSLELASEPQALGFNIPLLSANEAYQSVLNDVGANKSLNANGTYTLNMDDLDKLYTNFALNDNGASSYRAPSEWVLPDLNNTNNNNGYLDDDNDGMPNVWELANNFDPNVMDGNLDADLDGYTNLEEFLNQVD